MRVALYGRLLEMGNAKYVQYLVDELSKLNYTILVFEAFMPHLHNKVDWQTLPETFKEIQDLDSELDYIISFGGDGTILDIVQLVGNRPIPVVGINLGRLGFLATIGVDDLDKAVNCFKNNAFEFDERALLEVSANREMFEGQLLALNEFTLHKKDTSSMVIIHAYLNGEFLNTYWADGIIVSTPTGSTGYSLSVGGPVLMPRSSNFVIAPVAPHNLNIRPLIVPDDSVITFEIEGRAENYMCTLDGRYETVDKSIKIAIQRSKENFLLARLPDTNFIDSLRSKLLWGTDQRVSKKR